MLRGIYTAASGMLVQGRRSDVLANNLANIDTAGYQRQTTQVEAFPQQLLMRQEQQSYTPVGSLGTGATVHRIHNSFAPGRLHITNNPLDVAFNGPGFFVIDTPEQRSYTRDGSFTLNLGGWLTTLDGQPVLGENGRIYIGEGEVKIDSEGKIFVNGVERDRLLMVEFLDRNDLIKQGDNRYHRSETSQLPLRYRGEIIQGSLEMPNFNMIQEMVNLIEVQRSYEANQKVIQAYDETLGKAVNDITI